MNRIHHASIFLSILLLPTLCAGQIREYQYDANHSQVGFTVVHLAVSKVDGRFQDVNAKIKLDPADLTTLEAEAVMKVHSIDTDNENRDSDLMGPDFFAADSFPEVQFVSTGVSDVGDDGTFKLHGDLTIRDVTKPVVLDAEMRGPIVSGDQERLGFSASTEINRFDYGLRWNKLTEAGGLIASREVELVIEVELKRKL